MKIAFLGNFRPAHSTESDLLWTLKDLGHDVITMQEDAAPPQEVWETARFCGMLFWMHTHGWQSPGAGTMHDVLAQLRAAKVKSCSYSLDLFFGIKRATGYVGVHPFFKTDVFFGVDDGHRAHYAAAGVNHAYLRPGVVKRDCHAGAARGDLTADVTFVGSTGYHEEWPHRPRLIAWLRESYGASFRKWGNPEPTMRGDDLNAVYASSKIAVGDSLCPGYAHPGYWSDRCYETMGRGPTCMLIHPFIKGMQDEFSDGIHLRYFEYENWGELRRLIDYYLAHDDERLKIAAAGHKKVFADCTYNNRMTHMIAHMEGLKS